MIGQPEGIRGKGKGRFWPIVKRKGKWTCSFCFSYSKNLSSNFITKFSSSSINFLFCHLSFSLWTSLSSIFPFIKVSSTIDRLSSFSRCQSIHGYRSFAVFSRDYVTVQHHCSLYEQQSCIWYDLWDFKSYEVQTKNVNINNLCIFQKKRFRM